MLNGLIEMIVPLNLSNHIKRTADMNTLQPE